MQSETETGIPENKGIWVVVIPLMVIGFLINFAFYGQDLRDLGQAIGWVLLGYGILKNNNIVGSAGAVLALGLIAAEYLT